MNIQQIHTVPAVRSRDRYVNLLKMTLVFGLGVLVSRLMYLSIQDQKGAQPPLSIFQVYGFEIIIAALLLMGTGMLIGRLEARRQLSVARSASEFSQYNYLKDQLSSKMRGTPAEALRMLRLKQNTDERWAAWIKTDGGIDHLILKGLDAGGDFSLAHLSERMWNEAKGKWQGWAVNFSGHHFPWHTHLAEANLRGANLSGASLAGADLNQADLTGTDLTGTDLSRGCLQGAKLRWAALNHAVLEGTDLTQADLRNITAHAAQMAHAYLSGARLSSANLKAASGLRTAQLRDVYLHDASATGSLEDVTLPDGYRLPYLTWRKEYEHWAEHIARVDAIHCCIQPQRLMAEISEAPRNHQKTVRLPR